MACNSYPDFGDSAHVVVMQYFTPELVERIADDVAAKR